MFNHFKSDSENHFSKKKREFLSTSGKLAFSAIALSALPSIGLADVKHISFYRVTYKNWSGGINKPLMLAAKPRNAEECVYLANYVLKNGYKMRAMGQMHNWSPITIGLDAKPEDKVLLVDTSELNTLAMTEQKPDYGIVKVGSGVLSETLYKFLSEQCTDNGSKQGYAFSNTPAPGDITVGGMMAIGAHGTGVSDYIGSTQTTAFDGSMSNTIVEFTAIVLDETYQGYVLKTFKREDKDASAFLVSLGRTFITEFKLQVIPNYHLRCISLTDIDINELCAKPEDNNVFSIANILANFGRLEVILYPYTDKPWLKVWQREETLPSGSHATTKANNYPFSDSIPESTSDLIRNHLYLFPKSIPNFGKLQFRITNKNLGGGFGKENLLKLINGFPAVSSALGKSKIADLWGPAWQTLVYIRKTTLRVTANGYAIHIPRDQVQSVVHECTKEYRRLSKVYEKAGKYPVAGPLEIRITGLDNTKGLKANQGARTPALSALSPSNNSNADTAVWLDLLTMPNTKDAHPFYSVFEQWLYERYPSVQNRVEWSKGWAYTNKGPWTNTDVIDSKIPASFANTQTTFEEVKTVLHKYDPYQIFTAPLHKKLFK